MINSQTIQHPFSRADLNMEVAYDSDNNPLYVGYAAPGVATSTAGWQICKCTYDANGNLDDRKFADGVNDYEKVWDDRATYAYTA